MKVQELIEQLKKLPPDSEVKVWDGDDSLWRPVTGTTLEGHDAAVLLDADYAGG